MVLDNSRYIRGAAEPKSLRYYSEEAGDSHELSSSFSMNAPSLEAKTLGFSFSQQGTNREDSDSSLKVDNLVKKRLGSELESKLQSQLEEVPSLKKRKSLAEEITFTGTSEIKSPIKDMLENFMKRQLIAERAAPKASKVVAFEDQIKKSEDVVDKTASQNTQSVATSTYLSISSSLPKEIIKVKDLSRDSSLSKKLDPDSQGFSEEFPFMLGDPFYSTSYSQLSDVFPVSSVEKDLGGLGEPVGDDLISILDTSTKFVRKKILARKRKEEFAFEVQVAEEASIEGIAPTYYSKDLEEQSYYLEKVEHEKWPAFRENESAYRALAQSLRKFHGLRFGSIQNKICTMLNTHKLGFGNPMVIIERELKKLAGSDAEKIADVEIAHLKKFLIKLLKAATPEERKSWFGLCHGDFHQDNALYLPKSEASSQKDRAFIIDYDDAKAGMVFFDIAKFCQRFSDHDRESFFKLYLGKAPSNLDTLCLDTMRYALLLIVVVVRMSHAEHGDFESKEYYNYRGMNEELERDLPNFLTLPYKSKSVKEKQYSALCALQQARKMISELEIRYALLQTAMPA